MDRELQKALDRFLASKVQPDESGLYGELDRNDLSNLHGVISLLIQAKWGADIENQRPIEFRVVDRSRYMSVQEVELFYPHKVICAEEVIILIRGAMANVQMAAERLSVIMASLNGMRFPWMNK